MVPTVTFADGLRKRMTMQRLMPNKWTTPSLFSRRVVLWCNLQGNVVRHGL